jgi:hypothetical protein
MQSRHTAKKPRDEGKLRLNASIFHPWKKLSQVHVHIGKFSSLCNHRVAFSRFYIFHFLLKKLLSKKCLHKDFLFRVVENYRERTTMRRKLKKKPVSTIEINFSVFFIKRKFMEKNPPRKCSLGEQRNFHSASWWLQQQL